MPDKADIESIARSSTGRSRTRWLVLPLLIAAIGAAAWWLGGGNDSSAIRYTTVPAKRTDIIVTVTATGTIEPINQVDISSELSGTVRSVKADYNDTVKKGEVLAELDTDKLEAAVESARASVIARKASLTEAEATLSEKTDAYERAQALSKRGIASQESLLSAKAAFLRAQAAIETARANVRVAEADLKLQETNLEKACICSPIDGIVLDRAVEEGQIVASSLSAPTLFTLAESLTSMDLTVAIDEADIGQVEIGNEAGFTVEAWQNRTFKAAITQLRFAPETVDGVVTYKAVLDVDNSDLALRPGMTATAEIRVAERNGVLAIPNAALRYAPPAATEQKSSGNILTRIMPRPPRRETVTSNEAADKDGTRSVWVLDGDAPVEHRIRTGATDGDWTEVVEGDIAEGAALITDSETAK
ncbi:MAG: efflux RND transporter periplasmic adaptor subunit [Notoacmeibacter sp.]|nr:efflux RND transporter periplasmic adaptor subunit [Notoacmeibacter sp.]